MAQFDRDGRWLFGRIGYEHADQGEQWDEQAQDFVEAEVRRTQSTPFVADMEALRVSFQLKGHDIRPGTFRYNFQALLTEATPDFPWLVELEGALQPPWEVWREFIDRLAAVKVEMQRPNPRYPGEESEALFEKTKAAAATLALSSPTESLDVESSEFLRQAIELGANYGNVIYTGVVEGKDKKETSTWQTNLEGEVERHSERIDPQTGEVPPGALKDALEADEDESL
jgi:hypothetical protein